jgi:hypothetical protein
MLDEETAPSASITVKPVETATDLAPKASVVVYAVHSRPDDCDHLPDPGSDHGVQGGPVPSEWIMGVAHLDLARSPRDVPVHRWRQLVSDAHKFMTSAENWAVRAAAMGWDTVSLFGCSSTRPLDRLGSTGLLWNVAGGRLKQLQKDWAVIAAPDGSQRTYHRRPSTANFTLPWRLR